MLRIKEYDYFAPHNYALLPGFRYINYDRYDALSDGMKDIMRTGAWYKGPGSQWPLASHDEHYLDKDFADTVASESDTSRLSKCAVKVESVSCQCREVGQRQSDETIEQVRTLCTLPDKHRPAATLILDVLESLSRKNECDDRAISASSDASTASGTDGCHPHRHEPAMSIRFFIPRGLYGVWNDAVRRYVSLISPDDGVELLINNESVENFIALLLTEYLLAEKAHHRAARNNKVLERGGYKCQVPGCSNRGNIDAHHLRFRSRGGSDAIQNMLCLCTVHLWILHILHGLKIEGTAPDSPTFTFSPASSHEGQPFMIYSI